MQRTPLVACAVTALLVLTGLSLFATPARAVPHILNGFVGIPDVSAGNPANAGSAVIYMFEDAAAPIVSANYVPSDGIDPAEFSWDVGSDWPSFDGNTAIAVIETVLGVNGWTGTNWTTSTDGPMSDVNGTESLPDSALEALPTVTLSFGVDWINASWTGLSDVAGNIVTYTVFRGVTPLGTVGQAAGPRTFNDTGPLAPGTYCYQIGVDYRRDALGGTFRGAARSSRVCQTLNPPVAPTVTLTTPANGATGVALTAPLIADFSEPMTAATIATSPPLASPVNTLLPNTRLTTTHSGFIECRTYTAWANGTDLTSDAVVIPQTLPVPDPWTFTTLCTPPTITFRSPANNAIDVDLARPINITFSEAMYTVNLTVQTSPTIGLVLNWISNDYVSATHSTDFAPCQQYRVYVNGTDAAGVVLAPLFWRFNTICTTPFIVLTSPAHDDVNVPLDVTIMILFSEEIQDVTTTCNITFNPSVATSRAWNGPLNTAVNVTHPSPLLANTVYTVTVSDCRDVDGILVDPSLGAPNPFSFTTETPLTPTVVVTQPAAGAVWSPSDQTVAFNLTDDQPVADLMVYVNYTSSDGNGQVVAPTNNYAATNTFLWTLPCLNATDVVVDVIAFDVGGASGSDASGAFTIDCARPTVLSTNPDNNTGGIPVNQDIRVTFSEPMDETSTEAAISAVPAFPGQSAQLVGAVLTVTHTPLALATNYIVTVAITARDNSTPGNTLLLAYTFNFTTTTVLIPRPPGSVSASAGSPASSSIVITWTRPGNYESGDLLPAGVAVTYTVYRATSATGAGTAIPGATGLTVLTYTDTGLQPSTTYYYYATATAGLETSADSARDSLQTTTVTTPPKPPVDNTLLIVGAIIAIVVVLLLLLLLMRRKKKAEEAPAGEAPPAGEEAPPPPEGAPEAPPPEEASESPPPPETSPETPPKEPEAQS